MFKLITILCLLSFTAKAQTIPQYVNGYYGPGQCVMYNNGLYITKKGLNATVTPDKSTNWQFKGSVPISYVDKIVYVNKVINDPVCITKKDSLQKRVSVLEKQTGFIIKGDVIRIDTFKKTIRW